MTKRNCRSGKVGFRHYRRWFVSRAEFDARVAEIESDALLALRMAFADCDPHGTDWTRRANDLWAEVREP